MATSDPISEILDQWRHRRPDIDPSPMGLTGTLLRAANLTQQRLEQNFARAGLKLGWFDVLATIYRASDETGYITAGDLAQWFMISPGACTNRVDRLVMEGLVERIHDPDNRRRVLIKLTPRGTEMIEDVLDSHLEACTQSMEALTAQEASQLYTLLGKLIAE